VDGLLNLIDEGLARGVMRHELHIRRALLLAREPEIAHCAEGLQRFQDRTKLLEGGHDLVELDLDGELARLGSPTRSLLVRLPRLLHLLLL